jgi:hypothetical protein
LVIDRPLARRLRESRCAACHHVALLTPEALLRVGLSPAAKVLDCQRAAAVPRVREEEAGRRVD